MSQDAAFATLLEKYQILHPPPTGYDDKFRDGAIDRIGYQAATISNYQSEFLSLEVCCYAFVRFSTINAGVSEEIQNLPPERR